MNKELGIKEKNERIRDRHQRMEKNRKIREAKQDSKKSINPEFSFKRLIEEQKLKTSTQVHQNPKPKVDFEAENALR